MSTHRPRIGIATSFQQGEQQIALAYIHAIEKAGGLPLIIPYLTDEQALTALVQSLDGLLMTGGPAIQTRMLGEKPDDLGETDPLRLKMDALIFEVFQATGKPFLGICYGMQFLNAALGGTIFADVHQNRAGTALHSNRRGATTHDVLIHPETQLRKILGTDHVMVNTRHIQAVCDVGAGLRVSATAPDGVIEAIEDETGRLIGVQFHPEREPILPQLFEHLIASAASSS